MMSETFRKLFERFNGLCIRLKLTHKPQNLVNITLKCI
jgi:hypothetical protein